MVAGLKTLEILDRPGTYEYLDKITGRLINGIIDAGREFGHSMHGGHINGELTESEHLFSSRQYANSSRLVSKGASTADAVLCRSSEPRSVLC